MRTFKSAVDVPRERSPRLDYHDPRMTGRDSLLARNAEVVSWLSKAYGEIINESRQWKIFDRRKLGQFLSSCDISLDEAVKSHADAMPMPKTIRDPELCIPTLRGASFLTGSAEAVAMALMRRTELAQRS